MLTIPCCLLTVGVVKALTASATAMRIIRHDEVNIFILIVFFAMPPDLTYVKPQ